MVIVSSEGSPIQYQSTPFVALNSNGQVGTEGLALLQQPIDFRLDGQPVSDQLAVNGLNGMRILL